jgi:hypothetical protein
MYQSIKKKKIVLSICSMWTGEDNIYDSDMKRIELGVSIINKSKEDLQIEQIILRVRKESLFSFLYEDLPIDTCRQLITANSRLDFKYDLKPILSKYGDKRRICLKVINGKAKIESKPISIKEMHKDIIAIYARHF